ncbi:hypothetical protein D6D22_07357 [Aureobasidium pullulans]|uniref:Uncharacterized protein n=1 Tax=Aureobasidium pullulans TaxID=5580 RepID=A0A4S8XF90_AURPU|nr:hypothetical protein D6D22_07357 [Aureobasidium pullulans]
MRQKVMNSSTMRRNNHYYHHHPRHLYKLPPSLPFAALRPTFLFCIQLMFCCSRSLYQGSCIRAVLCQVVEDKDKTHRSGANGVFRFLFNIISIHFRSSLHTLLHFSSHLRFLVQSPESRDTCFLPSRVLNLVTLKATSRDRDYDHTHAVEMQNFLKSSAALH